MPDTPMPIAFIDTETLGLHPDAPIWEFACIKRFPDGYEDTTEFRIQHDPADWVAKLMDSPHGEQFVADYTRRYNRDDAATESDAAVMINMLTRGALVIACNPLFDLPRIDKLLRRNSMEPSYHYHPFDISSVVFGALAVCRPYAEAKAMAYGSLLGIPDMSELFLEKWVSGPPWKSDVLAAGVGVNSEDYARHTAAGDVAWTVAQWDAITGRTK